MGVHSSEWKSRAPDQINAEGDDIVSSVWRHAAAVKRVRRSDSY